jgi:hypothetical protein
MSLTGWSSESYPWLSMFYLRLTATSGPPFNLEEM